MINREMRACFLNASSCAPAGQSSLLYSALQTADSETDSPASSLDLNSSADNSAELQGSSSKPPRVPQRWRIVIAIVSLS